MKSKINIKKYTHRRKRNGKMKTFKGGLPLMVAQMALKKAMGSAGGEMSTWEYIKYGAREAAKALNRVLGIIITAPISTMDNIIPIHVCKKYAYNDYMCTQPAIEYFITGSKADYKKVLLDKDKTDCLEYDEKGNKIIECKPKPPPNPALSPPGASKPSGPGILSGLKTGLTSKTGLKTGLTSKLSALKTGITSKLSGLKTGITSKLSGLKTGLTSKFTKKIPGVSGMKGGKSDMIIECDPPKPETVKRKLGKVSKELNLIKNKLLKINFFLRKYECPPKKLKTLFNNIHDIELLKKMEKLCAVLIGEYKNDSEETNSSARFARIEKCDGEYISGVNTIGTDPKNPNVKLSSPVTIPVKSDFTYFDFNIKDKDLIPENEDKRSSTCKSCKSPVDVWTRVFFKYGCILESSISGNKNNINRLLSTVMEEITSKEMKFKNDPIIQHISNILKNIECRSSLRKIMAARIEELKKPKSK
jgi:hypothetical protein